MRGDIVRPIIVFKDRQQAVGSLREWQKRLGLEDWIIDIQLTYDGPIIAPNWGKSSNYRAIHVAEIFIPMPAPDQINTFPERYCQEEIVVHELLHVLLPNTRINPNTTEGDFFQSESHARLESIAKALIMSKYGVNRDWFYNNNT